MKYALLTDVGKLRENNQDYVNVFKNKKGIVFGIVADGMGGHRGGDVASDMAVSHLGHNFEESEVNNITELREWIISELSKENDRIVSVSNQFDDLSGMGTTMVGVFFIDEKMMVVNVGDSRCYIYTNNELKQLSVDHSLVHELLETGQISPEEAENHPQKNIITQTLGVSQTVQPRVKNFDLIDDSIILLCTDGLTNMVPENEIKDILAKDITLEAKCHILIDKANAAGGRDNITALLFSTNEDGGKH
ncbi:Stp1/IreP family PP2C-type Ser/Thr phosphatase [Companilactobacillus alimentarius]|uniref:protein-serine/threonine phosphatase n=1 Tax=Companilactobacillus alimentarius DSM 20249 TaxID=1423720 RepID=A0A2K9HI05_9LACO|nr:Stp1/IreP family PP2C-type Ser/Thr phosphatase [Companilactobacillus alimentarius]AUI71416.1 protein phosphatase [Companilactobacillus alimentarius DSM 20249]KRK74679.1 Serine threonine protein phosphatase [Companilactobacillus alimentarius DSM 20249]MDT6951256.1 Stp1/IreP family PP2C-type Ser/Thr phosphatase [Companilactobacillus alimentarius]GEO44409.1 serine/threonine protein phosphatase [Companilactobacillus alimentarius]